MTYVEYIKGLIQQKSFGEPIYSAELAEAMAERFHISFDKAAAATAVAVGRLASKPGPFRLIRHQKGIYYRSDPQKEHGINLEKLFLQKYLQNNLGYYSGASFAYQIHLSDIKPEYPSITVDSDCRYVRFDQAVHGYIHPSKTPITEQNLPYLQMLDLLNVLEKIEGCVHNKFEHIANYIQTHHLSYKLLLKYAGKHYSQRTLMELVKVAMDESCD